ncbi:MAG: hypothetical protein PHR46_04340, partial [Candidatus Absconditabacteria bacterium]|nr:hypothetical protein [Candidatus Absconditabacteria bacterium]
AHNRLVVGSKPTTPSLAAQGKSSPRIPLGIIFFSKIFQIGLKISFLIKKIGFSSEYYYLYG